MANPVFLLILCLCGVRADSHFACNSLDAADAQCRRSERPVDPSIDLSLRLLRHLYSPSRNLVFSPYSLVTALTMTLLGAEGHSRRQLMETLFGSKNESRVERFITLQAQMAKYNAEELTIGNFLYPDTSFPLKPDYQNQLITDFSANTKTVNFKDEASAMETINFDVSEATQGMIPQLLTEIDPDTVLILINTVYFKGMWAVPFEKANTEIEETFTKSPGGEVMQIPMMHHYEEEFPFLEGSDGTKCLLLPYNVPHMHLALLLPPKDQPIDAFISNLTGAFLESFIKTRNRHYKSHVNVALPRFKISSTHANLVQILESLGVSDIFSSDKANLGKLTEKWEQLAVSQIIQKAIIEVNEEGTEAAASTGSQLVGCSGFKHKVFNFIADRPFVYALVRAPISPAHTQILFMGVVQDPSSE